MQPDHLPNPKRFELYTQLPNGKGFKIKDSKYIYMFDKYGGFYDEYNNYYNQDGQNEQSPSDQDQQFQRTVLQDQFDQDDYDDYYQKQYGANIHETIIDDYEQQVNFKGGVNSSQKILQSISHNIANLHEYPLKTPLRVDYDNMSFKANKQQILKHYRSKVGKGILNVILTKQDGKFIGQGYFVCDNVSTAQKLIKYEGEQFQGRPVRFDVETVDNFLVDPVTKDETGITINQDDFVSLVKQQPKIQLPVQEPKKKQKKYAPKAKIQEKKQPPKVIEPKIQNKQSPVKQQKSSPVKQTKPIQQIKPQPVQQVKPQEPTWSKYKGEVTMFPKKTSFKEWMTKLGFNENEHFKNPQKIVQNDTTKRFATVQLRSDVYTKIEQSLYEGKKVHFEKIN